MQAGATQPVVFVVDDSEDVRTGLSGLLDSVGIRCQTFSSTRDFLEHAPRDLPSCLILDVRLPGASGLDFQGELASAGIKMPVIFISGHGDIPMTVKAMKAGAVGFLTKPIHEQDLLDSVNAAIQNDLDRREQDRILAAAQAKYATLSQREREVMALVTSGLLNKQIAAEIGLSEVTVKVHRHNVMKKLDTRSLPELVRIADLLGIKPRK